MGYSLRITEVGTKRLMRKTEFYTIFLRRCMPFADYSSMIIRIYSFTYRREAKAFKSGNETYFDFCHILYTTIVGYIDFDLDRRPPLISEKVEL